MTTMLVRIKPYNPRRRQVLQNYTHGPSGLRFEAARGWYKVDDQIADYLSTVLQVPSDPDSPCAFDIMTEQEAKALEDRERKAVEQRAAPDDPIETDDDAVSTADLRVAGARRVGTPPVGRNHPSTFNPRVRPDGAVLQAPPHYEADDPKGTAYLLHNEIRPEITTPLPGHPDVVGQRVIDKNSVGSARRPIPAKPSGPQKVVTTTAILDEGGTPVSAAAAITGGEPTPVAPGEFAQIGSRVPPAVQGEEKATKDAAKDDHQERVAKDEHHKSEFPPKKK